MVEGRAPAAADRLTLSYAEMYGGKPEEALAELLRRSGLD